MFSSYLEYEIHAPSLASSTGNPYDVVAEAVFTHTQSGEVRRTGMFFDGAESWKFRFTGTKPGEWTFTTVSETHPGCTGCTTASALAGHTGAVTVRSDADAHGFIVAAGNRWARQRGNGGLEAFVPQFVMAPDIRSLASQQEMNGFLQTFIDGHGFTGIHVPSVAGHWFDLYSSTGDEGRDVNFSITGSDPDPETFEALERVINAAHDRGAAVHIWEWGDAQRNWTLDGHGQGQNGREHRRLLRYIAARLGPIPGWSMGYGFDLDEWTAPWQMSDRTGYLRDRLGWDHMLGGRSGGPNSGRCHGSDANWHRAPQTYAGYEHHSPDYRAYTDAMAVIPPGQPAEGVPVFSEDRNRVRIRGGSLGGGKDYTYDETRQGLWLAMMAGGVANIWGNVLTSGNQNTDYWDGSLPYPNDDDIKTWSTFFFGHGRFTLDAEPANHFTNHASPGSNGDGPTPPNSYALYAPDAEVLLLYRDAASTVRVKLANLSGNPAWSGGARIVAVDAKRPYQEIALGTHPLENTTVFLPRASDWAIAVTPDGCLPDVNGDGALDHTDFTAWLAAYNTGAPGCDQNGDGACTFHDFSAWILNFNTGC